MAITPKQDIRRALLESLRPHLAAEGFKLRLSERDFVRRHDGYIDRFMLDFNSFGSGHEIAPWVALRIDRVEDLLEQSSLIDPKNRKRSSTISTAIAELFPRDQWKVRLSLRSESDIAPVTEKLVEVFQRLALLYFRAWSSLHAIDEGLNAGAKASAILSRSEWSRCSTGVVVARLVGRADYEQLAALYTEFLDKKTAFSIKKFLELLEVLKSVEPWSGVPEALGPSRGETAIAPVEYPDIEPLPSNALTPERVMFTGKYDDASWHYEGDFPRDMPIEAGGTHIGMFLAWALLSGLSGELHLVDLPEELEQLRSRTVTTGAFFMKACDGKLTEEDMNDEGNAFAQNYFEAQTGQYLYDYENTLGGDLPDLYHVADTWENFERIKPLLDQRFGEWRAKAEEQRRGGQG